MSKIEVQFDNKTRVVSRANLEAMCEHVSGTCHRYWIESESKTRVRVGYSNPNEYGSEFPMFAEFPCYPSGWDSVAIVLDIIRVTHDNWNGEGWQAFQCLLDCPTLWRNGAHGDAWRTHKEIRSAGDDKRMDLADTCVVCDLPRE